MGIENSAGLGVNNVYGPRVTEEARDGEYPQTGAVKELRISFGGDNFGSVSGSLPASVLVLDGYAEVNEAFVLGGTSPTINVGTSGSAATNGLPLDETSAEATGLYDLTPAGTWGSVLTAATTIKVELGGTSPTITSAGEAIFVIRYVSIG